MHQPVLLTESLEYLLTHQQGHYLDATFGRGGHSKAIMAQLSADGLLSVCDRDSSAIEVAKSIPDHRLKAYHCNYSEVFNFLPNASLDGILADFGICSAQLDNPARGFSFMQEGPLDMRMNQNDSMTLKQLLSTVKEKDLADMIYQFGEEKLSRRIARTIIERFKANLINSTKDLAQCAIDCYPKNSPKHPATRLFQALRIAVNAEFDHLKTFLEKAPLFLKDGGRLVLITFHSLEYTMVKQALNHQYDDFRHGRRSYAMKRVVHPLEPSVQEAAENPRSRSARLHVYQKISQLL